jgi:hypothetical protein
MRIVRIETCSSCPYIVSFSGGRKTSCGHPKVVNRHPYAIDRRVDSGAEPPETCPLDKVEEGP